MLSWMSRSGYFPLEVSPNPNPPNPNPNPNPSLSLNPNPNPDPDPNHTPNPNQNIVHVDPDHFKRLMPEWPGYTAQSERAGNFCHRESGYLQEIAQEVRAPSLPLNYCRSLLCPLATASRNCPPATASLYYCPSPLLPSHHYYTPSTLRPLTSYRWRCRTRRTCGSTAHLGTGHGSRRSSARCASASPTTRSPSSRWDEP